MARRVVRLTTLIKTDHGPTYWLEEFDAEGFALFGCKKCDYRLGINPYAKGKQFKTVDRGDVQAKHSSAATPECIEAAFELEIWDPGEKGQSMLEMLKSGAILGVNFGQRPRAQEESDPAPIH